MRKILYLTTFFLSVSCASVPVAEPVQNPGWERAALDPSDLPPSSNLTGNKATFIFPAREGVASVEVRSPFWTAGLPLEAEGKHFAGAVILGDPNVLEYVFIAKMNDGSTVRMLDPLNPEVVWKRPLWSVLYTGDNPAPRIQYFEEKRYLVLLPRGYYQTENRYPVMYWHDGQNMPTGTKSPGGGWKADLVMDELVKNNQAQALIQVGVFNSSKRMEEYTSWTWPVPEELQQFYKITEAERDLSLGLEKLITQTIIPEVDSRYRTLTTRDNRGIGGSSAGAMMALYMAFSKPQVFGKVAALAGGKEPYMVLRERFFRKDLNLKIYLDCGTEGIDAELLPETKILGEFLLNNGYTQGNNLFYKVFPGEFHNEPTWARHLPGVLNFLFSQEQRK